MGQLVTKIHNPDRDIHLEEQPLVLPCSSHCIMPQQYTAAGNLSGNGLIQATPAPQSPNLPLQEWAGIASSGLESSQTWDFTD